MSDNATRRSPARSRPAVRSSPRSTSRSARNHTSSPSVRPGRRCPRSLARGRISFSTGPRRRLCSLASVRLVSNQIFAAGDAAIIRCQRAWPDRLLSDGAARKSTRCCQRSRSGSHACVAKNSAGRIICPAICRSLKARKNGHATSASAGPRCKPRSVASIKKHFSPGAERSRLVALLHVLNNRVSSCR